MHSFGAIRTCLSHANITKIITTTKDKQVKHAEEMQLSARGDGSRR